MKNLVFTCLLILCSWTIVLSQKPLKERIVSFVELASSLPSSGSDAYTKCGSDCKAGQTVLISFTNRIDQWKKHFEVTSTGNINIADYTNQNVSGAPTPAEITLLQTYSDLLMQNQQLIMDFSTQLGTIQTGTDKKWEESVKNFSDEVSKCPGKHEGSRDEACVKSVKDKYDKILNSIINDYIKEMTPIMNDYRSKIKLNNAAMEDNLSALVYGDKASMPTTKNLIISIQGGLMALVTAYGETAIGMWESCCNKYSEIVKIKGSSY